MWWVETRGLTLEKGRGGVGSAIVGCLFRGLLKRNNCCVCYSLDGARRTELGEVRGRRMVKVGVFGLDYHRLSPGSPHPLGGIVG